MKKSIFVELPDALYLHLWKDHESSAVTIRHDATNHELLYIKTGSGAFYVYPKSRYTELEKVILGIE